MAWLRSVLGIVSLICWGASSLVIGLAQEPHFSAAIQHGDCDDLGEVAAPLTQPEIAAGPQRGNAAALPAASSSTEVPVSWDSLRTDEYAVVLAPAGADAVACGAIGGPLTEEGALIIGLQAEQTGGITGIALLHPTADLAQTNITLFVTAAPRDATTGPPDASISQAAAGTPSEGAPSVVVVAVGDIACGQDTPLLAPCRDDSVARLAESLDPDAVLLLGDTQYECGELTDFETFFDPFWGELKPLIHPAIGHHEYQADDDPDDLCYGLPKGAPGYWTYFGDAATPREPGCRLDCAGYYSFDLGSWHLIALNAVCNKVGGCEAGSPQEQWLRADLAAHPSQCTLAYLHNPRFSSGEEGDDPEMQPLWEALADAGADVVLAAHHHNYERFIPMDPAGQPDSEHGLRSFVVGTGGRNHLQLPETRRAGSEVANDDTFGVLRLELHDGGYAWEFVPEIGKETHATPVFTDAGAAECHD